MSTFDGVMRGTVVTVSGILRVFRSRSLVQAGPIRRAETCCCARYRLSVEAKVRSSRISRWRSDYMGYCVPIYSIYR